MSNLNSQEELNNARGISNSGLISRINSLPLLKRTKSQTKKDLKSSAITLPSFYYSNLIQSQSQLQSEIGPTEIPILVVKEKSFLESFGITSPSKTSKLSSRLNNIPSPITTPTFSNFSFRSFTKNSVEIETNPRPSMSSDFTYNSSSTLINRSVSSPTSPNYFHSPNSPNSILSTSPDSSIYSPLRKSNSSASKPSATTISQRSPSSSREFKSTFAPSQIRFGKMQEKDIADMRIEIEDENESYKQQADEIEWNRMREFEIRIAREDKEFEEGIKRLGLF